MFAEPTLASRMYSFVYLLVNEEFELLTSKTDAWLSYVTTSDDPKISNELFQEVRSRGWNLIPATWLP